MKVLLLNNGMHVKNLNALLKYKDIKYYIIDGNDINHINYNQFDIIYSPCCPINVSKYPNTKFIFGPHFSVFPESNQINIIKQSKNVIYVQPSDWARDVWRNNHICDGMRIESMPFGVDTEKFNETKPIQNRTKVFLYYKSRHPAELEFLLKYLNFKNIEVKVFSYKEKYQESDYINYLHESKFGIWLGRHESQGFALEEALSCNVPLFVWDVSSMNQEYGYNYANIPATCIPYWDSTCGEYFKDINHLESKFQYFLENIENYRPREYIINNLSFDKCENIFKQLINKI